MVVVGKMVTDVHCVEKNLNTREFIFLDNFHWRFPMKIDISIYQIGL